MIRVTKLYLHFKFKSQVEIHHPIQLKHEDSNSAEYLFTNQRCQAEWLQNPHLINFKLVKLARKPNNTNWFCIF